MQPIHAPTVSHEPALQDEPWLVRCETARVHDDAPGNVTGASNLEWVFAEDERGHRIEIDGKLVDGFLEVTAMHSSSAQPIDASRMKTREACLDSISRSEGSEQLMLEIGRAHV